MKEADFFSSMSKSEFLQRVVDSLEGFVVTDAQGRFVFVSRKWTELTGKTLDDVRGVYVHDVTPDTRVDLVIQTKEPRYGEIVRVHNKDGGDTPMISYYTPIFDGEELIGCATVCATQGMSEIIDVSGKIDSMVSELHYFQEELAKIQGVRYSIDNIAGSSKKIQRVKAAIRRYARTASTVIIQGETGTGKEMVAHAIHILSNRSVKPFVKINCAAIPAELLESELFGYVGGAFTGANRGGKKGKFQMADGGTLFLDEINQMPLSLQPKLLRALQEREIEPVGGTEPTPIDVRIIVASNTDLQKMVKEKKFREDLFYRLNVIPINVPPLRERKEDIPEIAEASLASLNRQLGMMIPGITEDAKQRLQEYDWPGNVRELRNVIERAMNEAWVEVLTWKHFEPYFQGKRFYVYGNMDDRKNSGLMTIQEAKEKAEKEAVFAALDKTGGNKSKAANILGITRTMLYRKMDKLGISQ